MTEILFVVHIQNKNLQFSLINIIYYLAQLEEANKTANQVTKSSENLLKQIKQARDELETDLKDTRNFVKDLRDFLSGRSLDLLLLIIH